MIINTHSGVFWYNKNMFRKNKILLPIIIILLASCSNTNDSLLDSSSFDISEESFSSDSDESESIEHIYSVDELNDSLNNQSIKLKAKIKSINGPTLGNISLYNNETIINVFGLRDINQNRFDKMNESLNIDDEIIIEGIYSNNEFVSPILNEVINKTGKDKEELSSYEYQELLIKEDKDINDRYSNLLNKKISIMGDSITAGVGNSKKEDGSNVSVTDFLYNHTQNDVYNLGIGGAAIGDYWDSNSFILRYDTIPNDSDIIIIFGGANDYFIGNYGDESRKDKTFTGDCYKTFELIKENYPNSDVFVLLTYKNRSADWNQFKDHDFDKFIKTEKQYAEELDLPLINLYEEDFLDNHDQTIKDKYFYDDIHLNDSGSEVLADRIAAELEIYYSLK